MFCAVARSLVRVWAAITGSPDSIATWRAERLTLNCINGSPDASAAESAHSGRRTEPTAGLSVGEKMDGGP
jgi:hypothetical protein